MASIDPVKEELAEKDEAFRRLYEEHQEFEGKLEAIQSKALLSEEDEHEIKRIKLHKLSLKDQMEAKLRAHEASVSVVA